MKLLPYQDKTFSKYCTKNIQELGFTLSKLIRKQVFYAIFAKCDIHIKSNITINSFKQLIQDQEYHYHTSENQLLLYPK